MHPSFGQRDPDARGYYGAYGGRFVPETLMAPIEELRQAYFEARSDENFRATLAGLLRDYVGRPTPLYEARRLTRDARRRAHLPQARGPRAHRRPQDQQRPRPGAARRADGQAARSSPRPAPASTASPPPLPAPCSASSATSTWAPRTWSARRSTSSACGCSAPRCGASTPAAARSRTRSTRRCATGSPTCTDTHYLLGSVLGPHPVSDDGARLPVGDRPGGARAEPRGRSAACPTRSSPASAAAATRSAIFDAFLDDPAVRLIGVEAGGRGIRSGEHAARFAGGSPACCTAPAATCCRTTTATSSSRIRSPPASTTRRSGPSTRGCATRRAPSTPDRRRRGARARSSGWRARRASSPALESSHAIAHAHAARPDDGAGTRS